MKKILLTVVVTLAAIFLLRSDEASTFAKIEFVTIRWAGRDNTHIIRPNGKVEFIGPKLMQIPKKDRVDDRVLYLNLTMNALGKEGYEVAAVVNSDEIIMKRQSK